MEDKRIKEILIERSSEFKKYFLEHQSLERKLSEIKIVDNVSSVGSDEIKTLKRLKLQYKDKMQNLIEEYKNNEN